MIIRPLWSSTRTPWPRPETSLTGFAVDPGVTQGVTRNGSLHVAAFSNTTRTPYFKNAVKPLAQRYDPNVSCEPIAGGRLSGEQPTRCARSKPFQLVTPKRSIPSATPKNGREYPVRSIRLDVL
jgi:hypothetical protein